MSSAIANAHARIHTCMHAHTYTHARTQIHTYTNTFSLTHTHTHTCTHKQTQITPVASFLSTTFEEEEKGSYSCATHLPLDGFISEWRIHHCILIIKIIQIPDIKVSASCKYLYKKLFVCFCVCVLFYFCLFTSNIWFTTDARHCFTLEENWRGMGGRSWTNQTRQNLEKQNASHFVKHKK